MKDSSSQGFCGNILVVDDTLNNLRVLSHSLTNLGHRVRCVKTGAMALLTIEKESPHLILLDIKMPDMDGYEVCQRLKANDSTCDIPIIFLSAFDDVSDKVKAFSMGGADYITKPFHIQEVIIRVQHQLALQSAKLEISELNAELERKVHHRTEQLEAVIYKLNQEIAEHQKTQGQLAEQALHDGLTGLPNRVLFMEHLQKALRRSHRSVDYPFAVLFIDLDRFKVINDSWGHSVGDQLIIAISQILQKSIRAIDTVARLSGDEFAILLDKLESYQSAIEITERLLERLTAPVCLEDRTVFTGASIGLVFGDKHYQTGIEILRDADIAMYHAKSLGRGQFALFDQEMYARTLHRSQLETDLRYAIDHQELLLHYQPIISLETDCVVGFEALVRWLHPKKGLIPPKDFIEISEDSGLIIPLGEWVLEEACRQLYQWHLQFPQANSLYISVNLSGKQIQQNDFVMKLGEVLSKTGLRGEQLKLELTESMLMDPGKETISLLSNLKEHNIQLSIDDFGTGYSSLSYLHRFPIDTLKIDRSFVNQNDAQSENNGIVKTIITLAHSLGMDTVAEGVETPRQLTYLKNLGCDAVQGYLLSKPLDSQAATDFIATHFQV